jgi:hypothetical protein
MDRRLRCGERVQLVESVLGRGGEDGRKGLKSKGFRGFAAERGKQAQKGANSGKLLLSGAINVRNLEQHSLRCQIGKVPDLGQDVHCSTWNISLFGTASQIVPRGTIATAPHELPKPPLYPYYRRSTNLLDSSLGPRLQPKGLHGYPECLYRQIRSTHE